MILRLVSPVLRPGSKNHQLVKRVPSAIRARMIGRKLTIPLGGGVSVARVDAYGTIRCSLRTADASEAKAREGEALAYLERAFAAEASSEPVSLSRAQAVALSRVIYEGWASAKRERVIAVEAVADPAHPKGVRVARVDPVEDEDGSEDAGAFRALSSRLAAVHGDREALERLVGPIMEVELPKVLSAPVTPASRSMVLEEFRAALLQAAELRAKRAGGVDEEGRRVLPDYSPDPLANRFPALETPAQVEGERVTLMGLVEAWWREQERVGLKPATYTNYKGAFKALARFLKHDDARRVTDTDVVAFKDHRLGVVSPRTVKDNDLAALKSVFGWAVANRKLPANPAHGITVKGAGKAKAQKAKRRGFTEAEAAAILRASQALKRRPDEREKRWLARRWAPWLMAYSGARVGEVCQLRKEDVCQDGNGDWAMHLTAEAGTLKTLSSERWVPLHPHLVELGFIDFVRSAKRGHLFATPHAKTREVRGSVKDLANKVREFVREVVPERDVDPNHGWRHRFKSIGRKVGIEGSYLDALCGHEQATVGREYGEYTLEVLRREVLKLPRVDLSTPPPRRPLVVERRGRPVRPGTGVPDTPFFRGGE